MKFHSPILITKLCDRFGLTKPNNASNQMVTGINEINRVEAGDICYVDFPKYYKKTLQSDASFIIGPEDLSSDSDKLIIHHSNPFEVYDAIAREMYAERKKNRVGTNIHPTAKVHPSAVIGEHVRIGAHADIDAQVVIHDDCIIGDRVHIEAGTVIGGDAFYFHKSAEGVYTKWFSCGDVIIEDDVSIGSMCTINRGVSSSTIIGEGSKLDCHIQIGHGVQIGKHCLIAAQVGISGKTIIGNHVNIYGQVGITQNLRIGDRVKVLAQSGVNDDIPAGETWFGSPAIPARQKMKEIFYLRGKGEV